MPWGDAALYTTFSSAGRAIAGVVRPGGGARALERLLQTWSTSTTPWRRPRPRRQACHLAGTTLRAPAGWRCWTDPHGAMFSLMAAQL